MAFKSITVTSAQVSGTHTNFPAYLNLSDAGITTQAEADSVRIYADEAKTNEIPREIVSLTQCHTKIPSFDNSTVIYIDYDGIRADYATTDTYGAENVWSDYAFVWHGKGTTDSTSNAHTISANGGVTIGGATGIMGSATDFDGVNDYLEIADSDSLEVLAGDFTMQSWFSSDVTAFQPYFNKGRRSGSGLAYSLDTHSVPSLGALVQDSPSVGDFVAPTDGGSYSIGVWKKHDAVFDRSANLFIYNDGVQTGVPSSLSTQTNSISTSDPMLIGCRTTFGTNRISFFNGKIGMARLRMSTLSSNWISTEYNNQSSPSTFWTYNDVGGVVDNFIPQVIFM